MVPTLGNDPSEPYDSGFTDHPLSLSEYVGIYGLDGRIRICDFRSPNPAT